MKKISTLMSLLLVLTGLSCAKDRPYLSGHIKRAHDAIMVPCDPYNNNSLHSCVVLSSAINHSLYVYDATASEMVLSSIMYFPLKIAVGPTTDSLISVVSNDKRFPFLFALDRTEPSLYPVRLFPSKDKKQQSFSSPKKIALPKAPQSGAAFELNGKIIMMLTYPEERSIELITLNKETGEIDTTVKATPIAVGTKPNRVVIDSEKKMAVISDLGEQNLHILDLKNVDKVLAGTERAVIASIDVRVRANQVYLSRRDFGDGTKLYALFLKVAGNEVRLVDIDNQELVAVKPLLDYPMAAYFPDDKSDPCCGGAKNWFSLVTLKGNLIYFKLELSNGRVSIVEDSTTDLTSEDNLDVSTVHIKTIVGGAVHVDASVKRESLCSSGRQTFYVASYANSRSSLSSSFVYTELHEVEGHGYSCEGEKAISRFGYKAK